MRPPLPVWVWPPLPYYDYMHTYIRTYIRVCVCTCDSRVRAVTTSEFEFDHIFMHDASQVCNIYMFYAWVLPGMIVIIYICWAWDGRHLYARRLTCMKYMLYICVSVCWTTFPCTMPQRCDICVYIYEHCQTLLWFYIYVEIELERIFVHDASQVWNRYGQRHWIWRIFVRRASLSICIMYIYMTVFDRRASLRRFSRSSWVWLWSYIHM